MPGRQVGFVSGTVVGSGFLNDQQDVQSPEAWGVRMEKQSATIIRIPLAGDGTTGTTAMRINGLPRWITNILTLDFSGTAAGIRDVYALAGGGPAFTVSHQANGAAAPANSRKLGEVDWDGAAITAVRNMLDAVNGHNYLHRPGGPDGLITAAPSTSLSATSTNTEGVGTAFARADHTHAIDATIARVASPTFTGIVTAPNFVATTGLTVGGDMALVDVGANNAIGFQGVQAPTTARIYLGSDNDTYIERASANVLRVNDYVDVDLGYRVGGTPLSSGNLSNNANLAKLDANPQTFTGANTFGGTVTAPKFVTTGTAGVDALYANVTGDASYRLYIAHDGTMTWGAGAGAGDTNLYRAAAGTLKTDHTLRVGTELRLSPSGGNGIRVVLGDSAHALRTYWAEADTYPMFRIAGNGRMEWGAGAADSFDSALSRDSTGVLKAEAQLQVVGDVIANSFGPGNTIRLGQVGTWFHPGIEFGGDSGTTLYRPNAGALETAAVMRSLQSFQSNRGANTADAFVAMQGSNTYFRIRADGQMEWYVPAGGAADTNLYRSAADTLKTDDAFFAVGNLRAKQGTSADVEIGAIAGSNPGIQFSNGSGGFDVQLYRSAASKITTAANFQLLSPGPLGSRHMDFGIAGDAEARFRIRDDGALLWGGGAGAIDTNLYRNNAGDLKTDVSLTIAGALLHGTNSGATLGFFGITPTAKRIGWGATLGANFFGATTRRSLTGSFTMNELRDVVATIVDDLRAYGLLHT